MASGTASDSQTGPQCQTINKLWEFPLISSAWTQSSGLYNRVKEASPLLNNALSTAESTVQYAAATATPTVQMFQAPLSRVDQTLTRGLNSLEQRVPLVKAEPGVLLEGAKSYIVSKVADVRQNVTVRSLKDLAKEKANEVLNSRYGNIAFQGFTNSTFYAESFIDHYLPLANETQDANATDYREVASLTTDQDKILFTIQTIGRIAGKIKRGAIIGITQIPQQAVNLLNRSGLMITLASYLNLVNQHLANQQSSPNRTN
uniref:Lipid storage droplets surface-binding protein 2 n=1 Tax=Cacopsylla melanoneura TaxID=428564 RepID=A0A8D8U960_9HEMI